MKVNTKQRKKARKGFEQVFGKEELLNRMFHIIQTGKQGLDVFIPLKTYTTLKTPGSFSEELLTKVLRGISLQRYSSKQLHAFGVSPGTLSGRIVEVTTQKLKEFKERDLSGITPFAIFIDTIHRANEAFMIALGIDTAGYKHILGFWQGATENHEICEALLADMERRGLLLSEKTIWVTDGGRGIIKALKDRFGKKTHPPEVHHSQRQKYPETPGKEIQERGA